MWNNSGAKHTLWGCHGRDTNSPISVSRMKYRSCKFQPWPSLPQTVANASPLANRCGISHLTASYNTLVSTLSISNPTAQATVRSPNHGCWFHSSLDRWKPMSTAYPSRRELRLQREREERARLRDEESQRWAEEVEQRHERGAETDSPTEDPTSQPDRKSVV